MAGPSHRAGALEICLQANLLAFGAYCRDAFGTAPGLSCPPLLGIVPRFGSAILPEGFVALRFPRMLLTIFVAHGTARQPFAIPDFGKLGVLSINSKPCVFAWSLRSTRCITCMFVGPKATNVKPCVCMVLTVHKMQHLCVCPANSPQIQTLCVCMVLAVHKMQHLRVCWANSPQIQTLCVCMVLVVHKMQHLQVLWTHMTQPMRQGKSM